MVLNTEKTSSPGRRRAMVHQVEKLAYLKAQRCEIAINSSRNYEQFGMIGVYGHERETLGDKT